MCFRMQLQYVNFECNFPLNFIPRSMNDRVEIARLRCNWLHLRWRRLTISVRIIWIVFDTTVFDGRRDIFIWWRRPDWLVAWKKCRIRWRRIDFVIIWWHRCISYGRSVVIGCICTSACTKEKQVTLKMIKWSFIAWTHSTYPTKHTATEPHRIATCRVLDTPTDRISTDHVAMWLDVVLSSFRLIYFHCRSNHRHFRCSMSPCVFLALIYLTALSMNRHRTDKLYWKIHVWFVATVKVHSTRNEKEEIY